MCSFAHRLSKSALCGNSLLRNCPRDHIAQKAENIYAMALYRFVDPWSGGIFFVPPSKIQRGSLLPSKAEPPQQPPPFAHTSLEPTLWPFSPFSAPWTAALSALQIEFSPCLSAQNLSAFAFFSSSSSAGIPRESMRLFPPSLCCFWSAVCAYVVQSCLTLCLPMDCSPPSSSVGFTRQ